MDDFKLNIEVNHATLAHHTSSMSCRWLPTRPCWKHRRQPRRLPDGLGHRSVPNNIYEGPETMLIILESGGFKTGGSEFRRKKPVATRQPHRHFSCSHRWNGYFARAFSLPRHPRQRRIPEAEEGRYASFDSGKGKAFEQGKLTLQELARPVLLTANPG